MPDALLDALPPFAGELDPDGEPWDEREEGADARARWVTFRAGAPGATDLVWTQKPCLAEWIWPDDPPPAHMVLRYRPPSSSAVDFVRDRLAPARVLVVTDLDPWGWVLARRVAAAFAARAPGVAVVPRGVDDALLALSAAWSRGDPSGHTIALSRNEMDRWAWLRPAAEGATGAASAALLDAGRKLEVEGATNPALHREGYADALCAWLLAR